MSFDGNAERMRLCAEKLTLAARSDPATAAELVEEIEVIAQSNPHPTFEAYLQRARGHLHQVHGNLKEAVQHYRRAFALFEQSNEEVEKARTASTLVGALVPLGEFEESLRLAKEARRIFQEANLQNRAARLDVNVGNLYHRLNQLDDALLHYERAAAVLENSTDREAVAVVLLNRSVVLMLLYRFDDALNGFLRARAFSEEHDLKVFAAQSNLAADDQLLSGNTRFARSRGEFAACHASRQGAIRAPKLLERVCADRQNQARCKLGLVQSQD